MKPNDKGNNVNEHNNNPHPFLVSIILGLTLEAKLVSSEH